MYGSIVTGGVAFFQVQRDGATVIPGALDRAPSHLNDPVATVYRAPHFLPDGDDVISDATLTPIGGPVNVAGGWFDAGDYLKLPTPPPTATPSCTRARAPWARPRPRRC